MDENFFRIAFLILLLNREFFVLIHSWILLAISFGDFGLKYMNLDPNISLKTLMLLVKTLQFCIKASNIGNPNPS